MYNVGDRITHPLHGAGTIEQIETVTVDGAKKLYYSLRIPVGGIKVMVPVATSDEIGVRPLISAERAREIVSEFPSLSCDMTDNWSRRYRENLETIRSGDTMRVASVVKGLTLRGRERRLSTSERKMLRLACQILISELELALGKSYEEIEHALAMSIIDY